MALKKASQSNVVASLCRAADENMLNLVLEGGNPNLACEIRLLRENPSRIRLFSVEAASEIVEIIPDAEFLFQIFSEERRDSVHHALFRRASELGVELDEYNRGGETRMQTVSAMCLSPVKAAEKLVSLGRIDLSLLPEWMENIPSQSALQCVKILGDSWFFADKKEFALGLRLMLEKLPADVAHHVMQYVISRRQPVATSVVSSASVVTYPVARLASMIPYESRVFHPAETPTASNEAVEFLRGKEEWDLLLYVSELDFAEAMDCARNLALESARSSSSLQDWRVTSLLLASHDPCLTNNMVREFALCGALDPSRFYAPAGEELTALLKSKDLSEVSARALLKLIVTEDSVAYMLGLFSNRCDDVVADALKTVSVTSLMNKLRSFEPFHRDEEKPPVEIDNYALMAKCLFEDSDSFRKYFGSSKGWSRSKNLDAAILPLLKEVLGENPASWQTFFSLLQNAEAGTIQELALAASSL